MTHKPRQGRQNQGCGSTAPVGAWIAAWIPNRWLAPGAKIRRPYRDWDAGRLCIGAAKTELRFLPMFHEIRKALEESWQAAPINAPAGTISSTAETKNPAFCRVLMVSGVVVVP